MKARLRSLAYIPFRFSKDESSGHFSITAQLLAIRALVVERKRPVLFGLDPFDHFGLFGGSFPFDLDCFLLQQARGLIDALVIGVVPLPLLGSHPGLPAARKY